MTSFIDLEESGFPLATGRTASALSFLVDLSCICSQRNWTSAHACWNSSHHLFHFYRLALWHPCSLTARTAPWLQAPAPIFCRLTLNLRSFGVGAWCLLSHSDQEWTCGPRKGQPEASPEVFLEGETKKRVQGSLCHFLYHVEKSACIRMKAKEWAGQTRETIHPLSTQDQHLPHHIPSMVRFGGL